MSRIYKLPLVLEPQPEGGYMVTSPLLPELVSEGDTIQEALHNASDALQALLEGWEALGRPIPAVLHPSPPDAPIWVETVVAAP